MNRLLALMLTVMLLVLGIGVSTVLQVVPTFIKYIILACSMIFFYIVVLNSLDESKAADKNNVKQHNNDELPR